MRLSSTSLTAIKMFVDIGEHEPDYVSLVDISKRKEVSKKFLEQIVILYKKANLLIGSRGNQGGYKLAKPMHQISLKDILEISENTLFDIQVDGNLIKEITKGLDERIGEYLASITLDQLVEKQINSYSNDYCI